VGCDEIEEIDNGGGDIFVHNTIIGGYISLEKGK